ncbi:MAG: DUF5700 domain-containing putative Zn-dependent protease [Terriglobales bacterium]
MRRSARLAAVVLICAATGLLAQGPPAPQKQSSVALKDLVGQQDPLARHDLRFDWSFAEQALAYLRTGNPAILDQLAASPAAAHMLAHARNFDYQVPKDSARALVSHLLTPAAEHQAQAGSCEQSLEFFSGPMLRDPHWIRDALDYLPSDFHFQGTLFLTFGYDIGVAFGPNASLNCAHRRFDGYERELMYYAIHELHHVGFMSYHPPPTIPNLKTCADVLRLVEYSTQMEGMGVLASLRLRRGLSQVDDDYAALQDEARMQRDEAQYVKDWTYLRDRGTQPADAPAWAVMDRMSSGERLWYRVGARMAMRIERDLGRAALVELVQRGPQAFFTAYRNVTTPRSFPIGPG